MKGLWIRKPVGLQENTIQGEKYRFTLLTDRLIRMEYNEEGIFEDHATQVAWNREFEPVKYELIRTEDGIEITTAGMRVKYDENPFSANGLSAAGIGAPAVHPYGSMWSYGADCINLKGTTRTLDEVNGSCELEEGLLAIKGCAVIDDSTSLVLTEEDWVAPRKSIESDIYLFVYGTDYNAAIKDFYQLTGKTPMLPRFALGNWWSRYYEYTEESYKELITRFEEEQVPFTVSVVDMDWHLVNIDPKYGSGWTGYTWNNDFFPDPKRFLDWLHEHGLQITLNLHPADGIRAYEKAYPVLAEALGMDPEKEEPVHFDIAEQKFLQEYFNCVLHPMEEEGVDFWWIDWQQGNTTKIPGLDPLWMLNHYHYQDSARNGKRPMTFSRYAGPGSHRYPVGFSGDTHVTWESLEFQPYFTSTASNIGYGWWSHDIGGHMRGYKDNTLAARWLQYGVFSPINRLHSTKCEFNGKEPWRYPMEIHHMMNNFLRLRHQMMPYLYTMNYRAWKEDRPIIGPLYYQYPKERKVYFDFKNQYFFGSELMVAPITTPQIPSINMGKVKVWLPEGLWIDFFTGRQYIGGRQLNMYRDIHSIPVLAKAGAIVPMTDEIQGRAVLANPSTLNVRVFGGADGIFTMFEDDNETTAYLDGAGVKTSMELKWDEKTFVIHAAQGDRDLIPAGRTWTVQFYGIENTSVSVWAGGKEIVPVSCKYDRQKGILSVTLPETSAAEEICIVLASTVMRENPAAEEVFDFINMAELEFDQKMAIDDACSSDLPITAKIAAIQCMKLDEELFGCLVEILTAK